MHKHAAKMIFVVTLAACAEVPARAAFDLQEAVRSAKDGEAIHVPEGTYTAPLVINRSITLVAQGDAVIDAGGVGDVLKIESADVTLRGFIIRNSGDSLDRENAGIVIEAPRVVIEDCRLEDILLGIVFRNAHGTVIRNNQIHGKPLDLGRRGDAIRVWYSDGVRIEHNTISGCRDVIVWFSTGTKLVGNEVSQNRYGMHFMYAKKSVLEDNHLHDNSVGVFLMYSEGSVLRRNILSRNRGPSGYGLGLKDMDALVAEDNLIVGNRVGIFNDNSPQRIDVWNEIHGNSIVFNDIALAFLPSVERNRVWNNAFIENIAQINVLGGGSFNGNQFTVAGRGNYWSDYTGYDADTDGIGDVEYQNVNLFESLMDRTPNLRLFLHSPAQQAIEFTARAFPVIRPEPRITDTAPLMKPPKLRGFTIDSPSSGSLLGLGVILLAASTGVLMLARASTAAVAASTQEAHQDSATTQPAKSPEVLSLTVKDLRKRFGRTVAVDGVSFTVPAGQALGFWGANGAGKTTILKCLLGLHRFQGQIVLGDINVRQRGKWVRRRIGYVPQELAFDADVTAYSAATFFARLRGISRNRVPQVLEQVGLIDHTGKRIRALSGGMKQRLALAIALLSDPPILLLDEPTSNLDVSARRSFLDLLGQLKKSGKTILYTTHRIEEVTTLADRLIVLERGRIASDGSPDEFQRAGTNAWTLKLSVQCDEKNRAAAALRAAGYVVKVNCDTLSVVARDSQKAQPIQLLGSAGIAVLDFAMEESIDERA